MVCTNVVRVCGCNPFNADSWHLRSWCYDQTSTTTRADHQILQEHQMIKHHHKRAQVLTGHCKLNIYHFNVHRASSPAYKCDTGIETINHYLFQCPLHWELEKVHHKTCFSFTKCKLPSNKVWNIQLIFILFHEAIFKRSKRLNFKK